MRLLIRLLLNAVALVVTAYLVPGFHVDSFTTAILAAIVLALINTFVKPLLILLTIPLTFVTLGLFMFVINAVMLWLLTLVIGGVVLDSFLSAILAAIVLSVVSTILAMLLSDVSGAKN